MADSLQVPKDIGKKPKVEVKEDNSEPLYKFIVQLTNTVNDLQKRVTALEEK